MRLRGYLWCQTSVCFLEGVGHRQGVDHIADGAQLYNEKVFHNDTFLGFSLLFKCVLQLVLL